MFLGAISSFPLQVFIKPPFLHEKKELPPGRSFYPAKNVSFSKKLSATIWARENLDFRFQIEKLRLNIEY